MIEGTRAIKLHVQHEDWQEIAQSASVFWQRVFSELEGRTLLGLDVVASLGLGFDVFPRTKPQVRQLRLELRLDRMEDDCMVDDEYLDGLLEEAWQAVERGLHISKVLSTHKSALDKGFAMRGGESPKKLPRVVKPRKS